MDSGTRAPRRTILDMTCITQSRADVTSASLRTQFARWPTGVAVITAVDRTGPTQRPIGKTVNSFHATSLTPPLVGWCLDQGSSQFTEWMSATGYVVHVVAGEHADLMTQFATSGTDRFAGVPWAPGLDGMPLLDAPVPLRLECRVAHRLPAGDHTYLIGEVVRMAATDAVPMCLQR